MSVGKLRRGKTISSYDHKLMRIYGRREVVNECLIDEKLMKQWLQLRQKSFDEESIESFFFWKEAREIFKL